MPQPNKRFCFAVAACAGSLAFSAPALAQQPLALSYKLEPRAESPHTATPGANRCGGTNWLSTISACGRDFVVSLADRVTKQTIEGSPTLPGARWTNASAPMTEAPAQVSEVPALPALGQTGPEPRLIRSAGGKEALIGSSRSADLLLRLGSKHRFKSNDEGGWDWYRFSDASYNSHLQKNGHKAVGVELLVPFQ